MPKPRKQRGKGRQASLGLGSEDGLSDDRQEYNPTPIINEIRSAVESWRALPESQWQVTPETARLLRHWRSDKFEGVRPFFCQVEAVETAIWMTEVAPRTSAQGRRFWAHLEASNKASNPELVRMALKLATGAGKTTVMAMMIAWQTVNAVRHPGTKTFSKGFLIVAPGITIRDRLRVLQPNDPDSYYRSREIVPEDMQADVDKAIIVITNYHAFKLREREPMNATTRKLVRRGSTIETEGQMLQRVCPALMGLKNIVVINDEAHHCYRERPPTEEEKALKGEDKDEAERNREAARMWISGLEAVKRHLGIGMVYDLSATPFFLRGSGYAEGSLFGWTMSDFSLMDAIECGVVKLPRIPVTQNLPGDDPLMFRNLWEYIGKKLPKKGRGKSGGLNPQSLPPELLTAIDELYGHYEKTQVAWRDAGLATDPVLIVVCNNTTTSQLVRDYIAGYVETFEDGSSGFVPGRLKLFRNSDDYGNPTTLRTLLIDSAQLDAGEPLDAAFKAANVDQIERFRREIVQRTGDQQRGQKISEEDLLREVMNTVGRPGQLGEAIRCVVSVSMLTEGWDVNTVTHVLGVRAFSTQLLCEQVMGRALRRQSYALQPDGLFGVEYADVFGIPFDFTGKPVVSKPAAPVDTVRVQAVSPERDHLEIRFPRVEGYRTELPQERLSAQFNDSHRLDLTPALVGPSEVTTQGIIGAAADFDLSHLRDERRSNIGYRIATYILGRHFREEGEPLKAHLVVPMKNIVRRWMETCLTCVGGTYPQQLLYQVITERVAERIIAGITLAHAGGGAVKAILDPYNGAGSTRDVGFNTSRPRYTTDSRRCHINFAVLDSDYEAEFVRVAEKHPRVLAYAKNHNLGFEVPYRLGGEAHRYRPDFIVRVDDGHGADDPLNLVIEISGFPGGNKGDKAMTMESYWVPGVNNLKSFGRWAFAELDSVFEISAAFDALIAARAAPAIAA